ncbi:MAG: toxin-antitoxin system HicB family antitoxin [Caldilineaceae bacterium]
MYYTIEVIHDESDDCRFSHHPARKNDTKGWFARVLELPGCMTQAATFDEIDEMIHDAMRAWIATALEQQMVILEPRTDEQYSGKFVVRVPRSLHKTLAQAADRDGVSLNTFVNVALAQAVGAASSAV